MKKLYGWAGKILRVDLNERKISQVATEEYGERFIGGFGIGQKIYWDETPAELDAFHPESPLIFMTLMTTPPFITGFSMVSNGPSSHFPPP